MKMQLAFTLVVTVAVLVPGLSRATSLSGRGPIPDESANPPLKSATMTKPEVVKHYFNACRKKHTKGVDCDTLRKDTVEILKENLHTLGSSAKRAYLPTILKFFKSDEPVLRIAAADAIGMIGPQDSEADLLAPVANDPVPDVRKAVGQMIQRGKGPALSQLGQRILSLRTGPTPEKPTDPGKFKLPVAPESTFLFYASDESLGRLSYTVKGMNEATAFFKGKAKKGPFKLEEFQEKYRYQLEDEDQAGRQAHEEKMKDLEQVKPDPTNPKAFMEFMEKAGSAQAGQTMMALLSSYDPKLFGSPTVYVLEERQIGQRSYPTRYVVLYQDQALKRPGYRLSWMTVPDNAVKAAQVTSLAAEKEDQASKKEEEAMKKRTEALDNLTKKKDAAEKKQFKKGQDDLEKALGF